MVSQKLAQDATYSSLTVRLPTLLHGGGPGRGHDLGGDVDVHVVLVQVALGLCLQRGLRRHVHHRLRLRV